MPVTLAQAKVGMADHVDQQVIDDFRRGSLLLDRLTFDNSVSPGTGGSTLTYGYTRLKTPAGAAFRELNAEYTETVADRETKSVDLKIFGGTFKVDRVLANTTNGQINEVQFQLQEHIKATINLFHYTAINGDADTTGFDGLDAMLVGSSTELNTSAQTAIDLSTSSAIDTNYKTVLDKLDELLSELDGQPSMFIGNGAADQDPFLRPPCRVPDPLGGRIRPPGHRLQRHPARGCTVFLRHRPVEGSPGRADRIS